MTRVVGVKGNAESEYRHGNVNLTPDDLGAVSTSEKGEPDGVAELDGNGRVPSSQLPSYVDDIIEGYYDSATGKFYEDAEKTTEITGETGKIYVSLDTLKPYRWSGSAFVEIPWGLVLGETANTAYRGDRGKTAYNQSNTNKANIGRIFGDIAAVETTTTATASHAAGSYILCEGQFYKVTAAIAVGDTIAEGTNVTPDTIANALANAGQVTGVKGNAESTYRQGNVNLTLANLGYESANNLTTTVAGKLLDARQGKVLNDGLGKSYSDLATVESTATASKAYAVKNYLVYNGQLYKVTSAIASGGTITPGTNVTAVKITDEMGAGGHTILNPSGTAVAQREKLQFIGATVTDDETNNKTVVTGNGHKILNSSGTALTQRADLQFSGMNASDDSTNNKTIVQGQLVKVTQAQYNALSTTQKNDPNVTWEITDLEDAQGISASITVASSGWSSATTTVGGVAYYTNQISLSSVFDSHPDILLGASGTFPTTAEKQAYMAVDYITVDASTKKLKCYARTKPTANFVIIVKGVSV